MKAEVSRLDDSEAKVAFARLCIITLDVHMTTVPRVSIVSVGKHLLSRSPLYMATIAMAARRCGNTVDEGGGDSNNQTIKVVVYNTYILTIHPLKKNQKVVYTRWIHV